MDLGEQSNPETEGEGAQGEALAPPRRPLAALSPPPRSLQEKGAARGAAGFDLEDVGRGLQSRYHLPLPTRTTSPVKANRPLSSQALPPPSPLLPPTPWQAAKPRPDVVFYV